MRNWRHISRTTAKSSACVGRVLSSSCFLYKGSTSETKYGYRSRSCLTRAARMSRTVRGSVYRQNTKPTQMSLERAASSSRYLITTELPMSSQYRRSHVLDCRSTYARTVFPAPAIFPIQQVGKDFKERQIYSRIPVPHKTWNCVTSQS